MMQRAMGRGAESVFVQKDSLGATAIVSYPKGRRGVVELSENDFIYGGCLRGQEQAESFVVDFSRVYTELLLEVVRFFSTKTDPVELEDTLEVMALLEAAGKSYISGNEEAVPR
jgi:hypothetical protein